jgi:hypothetical protein
MIDQNDVYEENSAKIIEETSNRDDEIISDDISEEKHKDNYKNEKFLNQATKNNNY